MVPEVSAALGFVQRHFPFMHSLSCKSFLGCIPHTLCVTFKSLERVENFPSIHPPILPSIHTPTHLIQSVHRYCQAPAMPTTGLGCGHTGAGKTSKDLALEVYSLERRKPCTSKQKKPRKLMQHREGNEAGRHA